MIRGLKVDADRAGELRGMRSSARGAGRVEQRRAQAAAEAVFQADNVRLSTGEYVDRAFYDGLAPAQQRQLMRGGIAAYNAQARREQKAYDQLSAYMADGRLDLSAAVSAREDDALRAVGVTQEAIGEIRHQQRTQVEVGPGQYITGAAWNELPAEAQARIKAVGIDAYNREVEQRNAEVSRVMGLMSPYREGDQYRHIEALADKAVGFSDLASAGFVSEGDRAAVEREVRVLTALRQIERYRDAEGNYDLQRIYAENALPPGEVVMVFGAQPGDSPDVAEQKRKALQDAIAGASAMRQAEVKQKYATPASRRAEKAATVASSYLDLTLPGYATVRHWDEMGTAGRAVSIAMDAAMVLPVFGAAGKAARSASVVGTTRLGRISAAAKGGAGLAIKVERPANISEAAWRGMSRAQQVKAGGYLEMGEMWRSIAWPAETLGAVGDLAKPVTVATVKGGKQVTETLTGAQAAAYRAREMGATMIERTKALASPAETAASTLRTLLTGVEGAKVAESAVTTSYHTVKFPMTAFDSPAQARRARNALIRASRQPGNHIQVVAGDMVLEFRRGPLMDKLGGVVSGTPMGEAFDTGLIVKRFAGRPWEEQGLFFSPTPLGRFVGQTARGEKGAQATWVIVSPEIAEKMVLGQKTYRGAYELETVLKPGAAVPEAVQRLYTRLGDTGQRVEILLPRALSRMDVVKLNTMALVEQIRNVYSPSVAVSGREWRAVSAVDVERWARKYGAKPPKGEIGPDAAKAVFGRIKDDKAKQAWMDLASSPRPLTKAEADVLGQVIGRQSPAMRRSLSRVSGDVSGALYQAARQAARAPEVYRVGVRNRTGMPEARLERVMPRAGEAPARFLERVEREVASSQARFAERVERVPARATAERVPAERAQGDRARDGPARAPIERATTVRGAVRAAAHHGGPQLGRVATGVLMGAKGPKHPRKFPAGSVAFAMGQLRGQTAYWVLYPPKYGIGAGPGAGEGKAFSLGAPEGVKVAPNIRSAYQSIRAAGGRVPADITGSIGFARYSIDRGKSIKFMRPKPKPRGPRVSPPRLSRGS